MAKRNLLHLRRSEAGVALLISIFALMLVSVMALSMIVTSGTESSLAGNYRSSSSLYYAALAGLEEGRGRLLPKNPSYLNANGANVIQQPMAATQVLYILNPAAGEAITPTALGSATGYPDNEYGQEFQTTGLAGAQVNTANSVSAIAGLPPQSYKWVRINPVTKLSLGVDVDGTGIGNNANNNIPLSYTSACADPNSVANSGIHLCVNPSPGTAPPQALEVTALAAAPDGSQKLLQYIVAPSSPLSLSSVGSLSQSFPAALTLVGNGVNFQGPTDPKSPFQISGNDQAVGACAGNAAVPAIGYTNPNDLGNVQGGTAASPSSYPGVGKTTPSLSNVTGLPSNMQTPSGLDSLVQSITQSADSVITGPAHASDLPSTMSMGNPMTVVINGDFNLSGNFTGYGLLVVTGNFSYTDDASWNGVILVIGQGNVTVSQTGSGKGAINGAIFVAQTRDSSGNLLPNLGPASFTTDSNLKSQGIFYSSCWVQAIQAPANPSTFRVLSFQQIPQ